MKKTTVLGIYMLAGLLFMFFASYAAQAQETRVNITGIRSSKGNIILNVFKNDDAYNKEQPFKKIIFDKKAISNGCLDVMLKLEPGIYGITLIDDENGNGKIDKNFMGMPKEGFGFSNFFMEKLKKPTFDEFKVDVQSPVKINIKIKYM